MPDQHLIDYIKESLAQGISQEEVKSKLIASGWPSLDIDNAFSFVLNPPAIQNPTDVPRLTSFLGAGSLLGSAFLIYKKRFGTFLRIFVLPFIAYVIYSIILNFLTPQANSVQPSAFSPLKQLYGASVSSVSSVGLGFLSFIFALIFLIIALWYQLSLIFAAKDQNIGAKEALRLGWKKMGSFIWISFLTTIIVLAGFILLIIPGLIFAIWYSLSSYVLIDEDSKGMKALRRSKELIKGRLVAVVWRFIVIGFIMAIISTGIAIAGTIISLFVSSPAVKQVIISLFSATSLLIAPLGVIYYYLMYKNLKDLKAGLVSPEKESAWKLVLVGLLIAVFLIGPILATITLVSLNQARIKARDARRQSDLQMIRLNVEMYYDLNNQIYPSSLDSVKSIMGEIPTDPKTQAPYEYKQLNNGKDFQICVVLESSGQKCITSAGQY